MKAIGVIPARWKSVRFEGKALAELAGRPVIQYVYERCSAASLLDSVFVATDDERIREAVCQFGGRVMMTSSGHPSGTDRVAEAAASLDADVVVNIQGDEPFISPRAIDCSVEPFLERPELEMTTLMNLIREQQALDNPNIVKVVIDRQGYALYFSRSRVPHPRHGGSSVRTYQHIGLYAYRKDFLLSFSALPRGELEKAEALEQLRVLENGHRILVIEAPEHVGLSIDTPSDLEKAKAYLRGLRQHTPTV